MPALHCRLEANGTEVLREVIAGKTMPESGDIQVTVELYGMWCDIGGAKRVLLSLPSGCTLTDLVAHLGARSGEDFQKLLINPTTGELWSSFAIAVNDALIERVPEMRLVLQANDRVSFFHPVTGG